MPSPAGQPEPPRKRTLFVFSQHQTVALLATAVDYAVMLLVGYLMRAWSVEAQAGVGTVAGSVCGAFVSFFLGRRWVFQSVDDAIGGQAVRYGVVSGLSMLFNAGGTVLLVRTGAATVVARTLVSVFVGMAWNFPMHRYFVFRARRRAAAQKLTAPAASAPAARRGDDAPPQTAPHRTS